ncbi:ABC-type amino acid transport/signal transduction systems, periplasmic component/domain [Hahella chejuensis KCTC 2396]|uniref:ABC-type amino acid transport/signal transduction systems, periplasmic component/domain n=1 Tax=Hahella chejuensis (strain KCTC 2396) TaxID=349521 RepID=Q2SKQ5_HAHCH|nr:transporter substrate-binding domain-containing protein [Hahella chejuensis]ABC28769.1 ABC-type amino acid transport/signal transduction systems, periplasmic component/domain [Hahella chejuensis KCTC 2396]
MDKSEPWMPMNTIRWRFFLGLVMCATFSTSTAAVKLTVGEWPPYASESLPYKGLLPKLVTEAFALEGIEVEYDFMPWARAYEFARKPGWDGAVGWVDNAQRRRNFWFSDRIIYSSSALFHLKDQDFTWNELKDLAPYRVGVSVGYSYGEAFDNAVVNQNLQVIPAVNDRQNLVKLLRREIDLFPLDAKVGEYLLRRELPEYQRLFTYDEKPLIQDGLSVMFPKNGPNSRSYVAIFNQGLKRLKRNGDYSRILNNIDVINGISQLSFYSEDYAPFNYRENGVAKGIALDLFDAIMETIGADKSRRDVHFMNWPEAYKAATSQHSSALFTMTRTPQREDKFKWVGPIYRSKVVLMGKRNGGESEESEPVHLKELGHKRICVIQDDVGHQLMISAGVKERNLTTTTHPLTCGQMLNNGEVDYWAYGSQTANWYLQQLGLDARDYEEVMTVTESSEYFAFNPGVDDRIIESFQKALDYLRLSGQMHDILQRYVPN